jgi:hypothetical protein
VGVVTTTVDGVTAVVPSMDVLVVGCVVLAVRVSGRLVVEVRGTVAGEPDGTVVDELPAVGLASLWPWPHAANRRALPPLPRTSIQADTRRLALYVQTISSPPPGPPTGHLRPPTSRYPVPSFSAMS